MLNHLRLLVGAIALAAPLSAIADAKLDIKRGVPADVHMAVYGKHNPERESQEQYAREAWETFKSERIGQRIVELIGSRIPQNKKQEVEGIWNEFKRAVKPFDASVLDDVQEVVVAQKMEGPFNHNLVLLRMPEEGAAGLEEAVVNVFELLESKIKGNISVEDEKVGQFKLTTLNLPEKCPMNPAVARSGDVVVFCTQPELTTRCLEQLSGESGESKFDDPRLKAALKNLPEAEDAIMFFDGRQFFDSLSGIADFIRREKPDDEHATRAARVLDQIVEHVAILDYEVTVEYTEEGQNRQAAIGKIADDAGEKVLGRSLMQQRPFDDWHTWIPADAQAYSLWTGANPHVIYEGVMSLVENEFPEAQEGLERFAEWQEKIDVHLDEDILQNISGECVSVTVPVGEAGAAKPQTVVAWRVNDADRLRELIARAFEALDRIPVVQAQGVAIGDDEDLDGFQQIRANIFAAIGVKPVVGFRDDWMIVSSHVDAARKVLDARSGEAETIDPEKTLAEFGIEATGETYMVAYSDVGAGIRKAADFVDQIGTWALVFGGAALANAPEKDAQTVREALSLLPSIAKVIRKLDFYEDRLSIIQEGPEENTYRRDTVTNIRQSEAAESTAQAEADDTDADDAEDDDADDAEDEDAEDEDDADDNGKDETAEADEQP
ncbi:MAG: hypothetical protein DCC67_14240 [Planctomycetota bacterium]|nr:MAG: hypothetical protein DCC67_14240 [Planctomycetota bacterium]